MKPEGQTEPAMPVRSNRRRWMRMALVLAPFVLLAGVEWGLRLSGYGDSTDFFIPMPGQPGILRENPRFGQRFFPKAMVRAPLPLKVSIQKPPNTLRIIILGESAARGEPEPAYSFGRVLQAQLEAQWPGRKVEVINTSVTAINSHVLLPIARECARLGADYWVVYAGNNEVVGPFGPGTVFGAKSSHLALLRLSLAAKTLRVTQLLGDALSRWGPAAPAAGWEGLEMFRNQTLPPTDPRLQGSYLCFEENLGDILKLAGEAGARTLLCTVAVNLKDSSPFASRSRAGMEAATAALFNGEMAKAAAAVAGRDMAATQAAFDRAAEIDPDHAELAFQRARLMLRSGKTNDAGSLFSLARDLDALRFRTDSRQNQIIREVASRHPKGVKIVDIEKLLARVSSTGIPGNESFLEYVHLSPEGNELAGKALAEAIFFDFSPGNKPGPWLGPGECRLRLGLTDWHRLEILRNIRARLSQEPFRSQSSWPERDQGLRSEIGLLQSRLKEPDLIASQLGLLREAAAKAPEDWMVLDQSARFFAANGLPDQASNAWSRVIQAMPHHYLAWYRLGTMLNTRRTAASAEPFLRRAVELRPDVPDGFQELGTSLAYQKRYEPAEAAYHQALAIRPGHLDSELSLGAMWAARGDEAKSLEHYRAAVRSNPQSLNARVSLSQLLLKRKAFLEAIPLLESLAREHPENVPTRLMLIDAHQGANNTNAVLSELSALVKSQPQSLEARNRLAVEWVKRGQWAEAEATFSEIIVERPQDPTARYNLAKAFFDQGKWAESREQLQEALKLKPEHPQSQTLLEKVEAARRPPTP